MTLEEVFMRIVAGEESDAAVSAPRRRRRRPTGGGGAVRVWPIYKKELRLYFTSPVAYGPSCSRLPARDRGYFFYSIFAFFTRASMQTAMNPQMGRDLNVTDSVLRPLFSELLSVILFLSLMPASHHAALRRGAPIGHASSCSSPIPSATAPCSSASSWRP